MKAGIFALLIFCFFKSFSQDTEKALDQIAFDKAIEFYYTEEPDSAISAFRKFLTDNPDSPLAPKAKYNIAYILREKGRDEEAISVFEDILTSKYNEKDKFGGLMEQYALYKHRSASNLADIYLDKRDYEKAKKYIRLFDKKYKYKHFCGNEMKANQFHTAMAYARLYDGKGNNEKAIKQLLPYIFDGALADNEALLALLGSLLEKAYTEQELRQMVKKAKSTLKINNKGLARITFFETKINVYDDQLFAIDNMDLEENMKLKGMEKWVKVVDTNPLFQKYID